MSVFSYVTREKKHIEDGLGGKVSSRYTCCHWPTCSELHETGAAAPSTYSALHAEPTEAEEK